MRPMRSALLWMARSDRLRETIPKLPFAQRAVRRFMPGERVEDALAAAERLRDERIKVLFTHLGENLASLDDAEDVAADYREVLKRDTERAHTAGPIELSIKPTQLGLDQDYDACLAHCHDIARSCADAGTWFWVDMEGSEYTDRTMDLAEALLAEHDNVGIALQAYLRRSAADVVRLLPLKPAIRLVKGAYDEPTNIAYRDAAEVDGNFLGLALMIAGPAGRGEARLALGTHDVGLIHQIGTIVEVMGIGREVLEVHMLYGIREQELRRLRDAGHPAYSLVAYGEAWYCWYMRRLAERPANVIFALRQVIP
ncbi:MAG: proline dehydrogenase [Planctomycetota bacterium]|nr:MAG: proline dehydrogenase [Planctomycetota bacterium]